MTMNLEYHLTDLKAGEHVALEHFGSGYALDISRNSDGYINGTVFKFSDGIEPVKQRELINCADEEFIDAVNELDGVDSNDIFWQQYQTREKFIKEIFILRHEISRLECALRDVSNQTAAMVNHALNPWR